MICAAPSGPSWPGLAGGIFVLMYVKRASASLPPQLLLNVMLFSALANSLPPSVCPWQLAQLFAYSALPCAACAAVYVAMLRLLNSCALRPANTLAQSKISDATRMIARPAFPDMLLSMPPCAGLIARMYTPARARLNRAHAIAMAPPITPSMPANKPPIPSRKSTAETIKIIAPQVRRCAGLKYRADAPTTTTTPARIPNHGHHKPNACPAPHPAVHALRLAHAMPPTHVMPAPIIPPEP